MNLAMIFESLARFPTFSTTTTHYAGVVLFIRRHIKPPQTRWSLVWRLSPVYFIAKHCKLPVLFIQARTNDSLVSPSYTPSSFPALGCFTTLVSFIAFKELFFLAVRSSVSNLGFFLPVPLLPLNPASELQCRGCRGDACGSGDTPWICELGSLQGGLAIEFG